MITLLAKLLKILNSETAPGQISAGLCLAMFFAFIPLITLQHILILFLVLVLRVNLTGFILGWIFFAAIAFLLDPLFHSLGLFLLTGEALSGFWSALYEMALLRLTRFNNTVVMGGFVLAIILVVPLYMACNALIRRYRQRFMAWVEKTRIAQMVKASRVYAAYRTVSGWRNP